MSEVLLKVENLKKAFPVRGGVFLTRQNEIRAVDGVSFDVRRGETFGLVGESGCGKSTLGRCVLNLIAPDSGAVSFAGQDLGTLNSSELRSLRKKIQIVFQDPYSSLNPRLTVQDTLEEPMIIHGLGDRSARIERLLDCCGLPRNARDRFPHEFSGGQRQRVCIARALSVEPEFIVCDEPVSALDVSVRAQILKLLGELQKEFALSYLFISHDLSVIEAISDRLAVMYLGRIVESGETREVYENPAHPYTRSLLSSIPRLDRPPQPVSLKGEPPSVLEPPSGCHFHPRCPIAKSDCSSNKPELRHESALSSKNHHVACPHAVTQ